MRKTQDVLQQIEEALEPQLFTNTKQFLIEIQL